MRGDSSFSINDGDLNDTHEDSFLAALEGHDPEPPKRVLTPSDLRLVNRKIPMRFCEYKISNTAAKMLQTDSVSVSNLGIMFHSPVAFTEGILMRVWMEMPDYWARKSRHVTYRHTNAPSYFQILGRVVTCEDVGKRIPKFQLLCENVNLDPVDELVLCEYLGLAQPEKRD